MQLRFVFILLSLISLLGCKKEEIVEFTFLQLNDVYEISPLEGGKVGGLARVETIHKQLLKENPNTFMFLAGDFLNPSLLGNMKNNGKRIKGEQMIEMMNAMNFDLVAFGNHEFDLKEKEFQVRLDQSKFPWIGTNLLHISDSSKTYFKVNGKDIPKTHTLSVEKKDGSLFKIGFISACINSNPKPYVEYLDFYEQAKNSFRTLNEKTDIVFGLTHLSLEQDKLFAKTLPELPLIMGGHEHVNMNVSVGKSRITKADANAKTVYVHRVKVNTATNETSVVSELVNIDDTIEDDIEIAKIAKKWNVFLNEKLARILKDPNEVIYNATQPLDGRDKPIRSVQTNLGQLITKAMAFSYDNKVDAAIVNGGSIRIDDQLKGGITGVDIFRVLPFGGAVLKIDIKGNQLIKVLDFGRLKAGKGAYLQHYNLAYLPEQKYWEIGNEKINSEQTYSIAISDYLLRGIDIPMLNESTVEKVYDETELASDIRKAIIEYLKTITD